MKSEPCIVITGASQGLGKLVRLIERVHALEVDLTSDDGPGLTARPRTPYNFTREETMVATLSVGGTAPDFALKDQHGQTVRLSDFRGRKLLVYFYPKADTPGCTRQSCSVRDARPDLASLGVDAVGISADSVEDQARFDAKYSLGFPLLADADHGVCTAWGVWDGKRITRSSFLVGEDGRLVGAWYDVKPEQTVPKARAALADR